MSDHLARRLTHRNSPGVGGAHHHALQHGLAADQGGLFAAFQSGKHLHHRKKARHLSETFHAEYWMRGRPTRFIPAEANTSQVSIAAAGCSCQVIAVKAFSLIGYSDG